MSAVTHCRSGFGKGITRTTMWRVSQLSALEDLIRSERKLLSGALAEDLRKSATEAWETDLYPALAHIRHLKKNVRKWVKPQKVKMPFAALPGKAYTLAEPLGVCLIIAPWNYPVLLSLTPLASALAAGNAAVLKPSELAPASSAAIADCCERYLDQDVIQVVQGGIDETQTLLRERLDHIFFTGSTRVGHIISEAAASTLTPVTLELGGKSPAIVDATANIAVAAKRIAWGKFLNAGQSCIAPDFVLVDRTILPQFIDEFKVVLASFYDNHPNVSSDLGRIIDVKNVDRITALLDDVDPAKIVVGGQIDTSEKFVAPTVVVDPDLSSQLMKSEIFGPILPILATDSVEDSLRMVNEFPKPLALYLFSNDSTTKELVLNKSSSGTVGINHTMYQMAIPDLPFGGVGLSGHGRYHGKCGFDTFSNSKSVVEKPVSFELGVFYPPLSRVKKSILRLVLR